MKCYKVVEKYRKGVPFRTLKTGQFFKKLDTSFDDQYRYRDTVYMKLTHKDGMHYNTASLIRGQVSGTGYDELVLPVYVAEEMVLTEEPQYDN